MAPGYSRTCERNHVLSARQETVVKGMDCDCPIFMTQSGTRGRHAGTAGRTHCRPWERSGGGAGCEGRRTAGPKGRRPDAQTQRSGSARGRASAATASPRAPAVCEARVRAGARAPRPQ